VGGFAGFSTKSITMFSSFTAITPNAVASCTGTGKQAMVHFASFTTWSSSMRE